jgi:hypothetical protein
MAITVPYTFVSNTDALAAEVNANFDEIESKALDKTGDTATGTIIFTGTCRVTDSTFEVMDNSDNTKKVKFEVSGVTTATTRTLTVPDASTTLVGTDTTQTLTNKTLTSPTVNTPTIAGATLNDGTTIEDETPAVTTNKLYNASGTLMFNGSQIGTAADNDQPILASQVFS